MISILSESPSAARLADTDILLQFTKQPCQKRLPGLSSNVSLRSRSLYLVFSLSLKRNNSLSNEKELFPIGQKMSFPKNKISALKRYSFTITIKIFLIISHLITSISKIYTVERKKLTLYRHTITSKSETITPERKTFTPKRKLITAKRYILTSNGTPIAAERQSLTLNSKAYTTFTHSVFQKGYSLLS
jgi:hypothetical protein